MIEILLPNGVQCVSTRLDRLHEEYIKVGNKTKRVIACAEEEDSLDGINALSLNNLNVHFGNLNTDQVKEVLTYCFKNGKLSLLDENPFSFSFDIVTDERKLKEQTNPYLFYGKRQDKPFDLFSSLPIGNGVFDVEDDWDEEDIDEEDDE